MGYTTLNIQIKSIILYNSVGDVRIIPFKIGRVNIITGESGTGKSAIIKIIEYCLGHSRFNIPAGKIRENVTWYAVLYQIGINGMQVFVAKPAPMPGTITQSEVFLKVGNELKIPDLAELQTNTNDEEVKEYFSQLLGISPNLNVPNARETRQPLEANLKHASFYLFQAQGEIANQDILFHRQSEDFIPQAMKDTLPYLLGAVQEKRLRLVREQREARRELAKAQRKLTEVEAIQGEGTEIGARLLAEAQQANLLEQNSNPKTIKEIVNILRQTLEWKPKPLHLSEQEYIEVLQQELGELRKRFREKTEQIKTAEKFSEYARGYTSEANEQRNRLESINLFSRNSDQRICPICSSDVSGSLPTISSITDTLTKLSASIDRVNIDNPKLFEYIKGLREEREILRQQIQEKELELEASIKNDELAQEIRDSNIHLARIIGRVSLYLETADSTDEIEPLRKSLREAEKKVKYYDELLDPSDVEAATASALNLIGEDMTNWAKELELEFSEFRYRLDLNKLTVVADQPGEPIFMSSNMGSGKNWLGCHLIAHLALHKYFAEQRRPVPNFLILDQPTQVFFPPESLDAVGGDTEQLENTEKIDADRKAVNRIFNLLFKVCAELSPKLQIVVIDHANLASESFQDALIEQPWRDGNALIPKNWLE
jgi:hypothetical protein